MKKKFLVAFLASLAITVACSAPSAAQSLPSSMQGKWCLAAEMGKKITRYVRGRCDGSDGQIKVGPVNVKGWEWGCNFKRVASDGRGYRTVGKCGGEGALWDQEHTFVLDGRSLVVRYGPQSNQYSEHEPLTCRGFKITPPEPPDADPVMLAMLNFDDGFSVTHVTRSGKTYRRADQYRDVRVWEEGTTTYWSGILKKDPHKRMTGSVVSEGDKNRYVEEVYDGGRLVITITSTCEVESDRAPTGKNEEIRLRAPSSPMEAPETLEEAVRRGFSR